VYEACVANAGEDVIEGASDSNGASMSWNSPSRVSLLVLAWSQGL
jgi:hypothetical protein